VQLLLCIKLRHNAPCVLDLAFRKDDMNVVSMLQQMNEGLRWKSLAWGVSSNVHCTAYVSQLLLTKLVVSLLFPGVHTCVAGAAVTGAGSWC
jgi:hypothetical protein